MRWSELSGWRWCINWSSFAGYIDKLQSTATGPGPDTWQQPHAGFVNHARALQQLGQRHWREYLLALFHWPFARTMSTRVHPPSFAHRNVQLPSYQTDRFDCIPSRYCAVTDLRSGISEQFSRRLRGSVWKRSHTDSWRTRISADENQTTGFTWQSSTITGGTRCEMWMQTSWAAISKI